MSDESKPQSEPQGNGSEVARLLKLIDAEYRAALSELHGVATGISNHQFINQRVENMERFRKRVVDLVGDEDEANKMVMEQIDKAATQKLEEDES
jgi:hypothetical protein